MNAELLQFLFSFRQVCEKFNEMMPNNIRTMRMGKEILDLTRNPPHGITCWPKNDRNDLLEASKMNFLSKFINICPCFSIISCAG